VVRSGILVPAHPGTTRKAIEAATSVRYIRIMCPFSACRNIAPLQQEDAWEYCFSAVRNLLY
jgi:hypothetical protein